MYQGNVFSFTELLEKGNLTTIHNKNTQLLATELFKVKNGLSPPFYECNLCGKCTALLRLKKKTDFKRNVKTVYNGTETLAFWGPRI